MILQKNRRNKKNSKMEKNNTKVCEQVQNHVNLSDGITRVVQVFVAVCAIITCFNGNSNFCNAFSGGCATHLSLEITVNDPNSSGIGKVLVQIHFIPWISPF